MLQVKNLNYRAKNFSLKNISLSVGKGEYFVLLGPTGSGKTLLLKNIAGLVAPSSSDGIYWDEKNIASAPAEERLFAYLAQDYRLFPHLDVKQNILFSPRLKLLSPEDKKQLLERLVFLLGLNHLVDRRVDKLSGGERQRVAFARALASSPRVILLDEPFSAIDTGFKRHLWFEIKNALVSVGVSVIHVTHDIEEAMTMGDRVAVIIDGGIAQEGMPEEILLRPSSEAVARYLGIKNIYRGEILRVLGDGKIQIECSGVKITAPPPRDKVFSEGEVVTVCVRPQTVKIIRGAEPLKEELRDNVFEGEIIRAFFYSGESASIFLKRGDLIFEARFPQAIYKRYDLFVGKKLTFALWQPDIMVYKNEKETGRAIEDRK